MQRIVYADPKMTWREFSALYAGFFPTSDAAEQEQLLRAEYEKHTGRKPDGEDSGTDQQATNDDTLKGGGVSLTGSKRKRERSNKREH